MTPVTSGLRRKVRRRMFVAITTRDTPEPSAARVKRYCRAAELELNSGNLW